jgi:hypothetical protein
MNVRILKGSYCGKEIHNQEFEMVKPIQLGSKGPYITVRPNDLIGTDRSTIRIHVDKKDVEFCGKHEEKQSIETDEQVMDRIETRFGVLEEMTRAAINSDVRAMIVVGPPGVGKSYGVQTQLEKSSMFDRLAGSKVKYDVVKGAMTAIGLYATLYNHAEKGNVLVFDDCDSILLDDLSLNLLKAALDSGKKRTIHWNADSSLLRREGIPDRFDFHGAVIFITNLKFDHVRSKKLQDHLEALQSRCHYIDLTLDTMRDKLLRIKQIHRRGDLFEHHYFQHNEGEQVITFMEENKDKLREMSLRMALKLADLIKVSPTRWKDMAEVTCMKTSF